MGCAKEEPAPEKQSTESMTANERFKSFLSVLETGREALSGVSQRSETSISKDEAIWGVEATLNVIYGHGGVVLEARDSRNVVFTIPLVDGKVKASDAYLAFEKARQEMANFRNLIA